MKTLRVEGGRDERVNSKEREVREREEGMAERVREMTEGLSSEEEEERQLMNFIFERLRDDVAVVSVSSMIAPFPLSLFTPFHSTSPSLLMVPPFRLTAAVFFRALGRAD